MKCSIEANSPMRRLLLYCLLPLALISCSSRGNATLEQEQLFSIPIGKMEDQLDIYYDGISSFDDRIRVNMKDGIIFLANSRGRKVMEFSSYGDLLSLHYNPDFNPKPVLLNTPGGDDRVSSRVALPFPFLEVGEIAVSSEGNLLVEDAVPDARAENSPEMHAYLNRVVRRFDSNGNYMDYLGQEGIGGTPFPYIENIHVNSRDEIIIVSRGEDAWLVFWFTSGGTLKYQVTVPLSNLPAPDEQGIIPSLEKIIPDTEEDMLYVKIDTYREVRESISGTGTRIDYFASYFFWLNPATGEYEGSMEVPHVVRKQEIPGLGAGQDEEVLHEFLGVARGGFFFLIGPFSAGQYQILVVDRNGVVIDRPRINLQDREIFYRDFHLNNDGILTAVLCREYEADLVWWRTDRVLDVQRDAKKKDEAGT